MNRLAASRSHPRGLSDVNLYFAMFEQFTVHFEMFLRCCMDEMCKSTIPKATCSSSSSLLVANLAPS